VIVGPNGQMIVPPAVRFAQPGGQGEDERGTGQYL
jgi:hypothetical protein